MRPPRPVVNGQPAECRGSRRLTAGARSAALFCGNVALFPGNTELSLCVHAGYGNSRPRAARSALIFHIIEAGRIAVS
jgi:hypothetical protein